MSDLFGGAASFPGRSMDPSSSHPLYQRFLDSSSQQRQTPTLLGKRTLAEFQNHNLNHNHNQNQNQVFPNFLLRSVKPRTFHPLSPTWASPSPSQRFCMPLLHPNPINLPNAQTPFAHVQNTVLTHETQNRIIGRRLQELEKQLLEDTDDDEGDALSVVTNSEWSETIQNLISPGLTQTQTKKPVSSSPTSSTTSSNSSSISVASPASCSSKQTLTEAASAISEGRLDAASEILTRLAQAPNPNVNLDRRFTDCMVSALKSRMNPVENPRPVAELFSREHAESTQLLFEHSLCFKLAFMAANLAILEAAFEDTTQNNVVKFCVLDFDVGLGNQYGNLLHALKARLNGKPATLRIAAVENGGDESLNGVGEMLGRQAERLGIGFEFKVVTHQLAELTRESLGCDPDESLVVNFAFKLYRMPDESVSTENPRDDLLRRVKALAPRVVTLVEQEINTNTAPFVSRVAESCSYYGALFDSIESCNSERGKLEEGLSRKVGNSIACEGRDRVERCEVFGKWRARMGMAGFRVKPVSHRVAESLNARLGPGNRVSVKEENGGVCFGWMGRTLTVASAWR